MKKFPLIKKLEIYNKKFLKISKCIENINPFDEKKYKKLLEQYSQLKNISILHKEYHEKLYLLKDANNIIKNEQDREMKKFVFLEKKQICNELICTEKKIEKFFLEIDEKKILKKKYNNNENYNNIILELRSGTGGDEACLFVEDILRMYIMYFKKKKWKCKIININRGKSKGFKEVVLDIKGFRENDKVYENLKFESGVHRVQRIPKTESQGRIHTSAITVAVLPKIKNIKIDINLSDIKKETFRSSGAGGQHVNKTESAVRLTYIPNKITVECQEERSQHKNFEKAMRILKLKIYRKEMEKKIMKRSIKRKSLVSTGDRSVKIRTYNYPNNRVTDHRIHKSIHNLENFMNGNIQKMITWLKLAEKKNIKE